MEEKHGRVSRRSYNSGRGSVELRRNQDLIDHVEDPVNADVVAVGHVRPVDEDMTLKKDNRSSRRSTGRPSHRSVVT